ncbi:hypothetical protein [Mixta calida]|uniref:hypothetical protein n=1 Tax=Mixta calida TaxID=665913 RepID=UPI0034D76F99
MPRYYEIDTAFRRAIQMDSRGRRTVTTRDFVAELARVNWSFSMAEANQWIENNISTFKDISTAEGQERTFLMFNPNNGGLG